jgi:predicted DNA-binding protein (MmcQ/YjbR family)
MSQNPLSDVELIRAMALSLPGASESLKWGNNLCFTVAGRIFLIVDLDEVPPVITFKSDVKESSELLELPGLRKAAYLGRYQWLSASSPEVFTPLQWENLIARSYQRVFARLPLKVQKALGAKTA